MKEAAYSVRDKFKVNLCFYISKLSFCLFQILHSVFPGFQVENSKPKSIPHCLIASGADRLSGLDLSPTSYLCVCQGLLAVLAEEDLLSEFAPDKCLLIDVLLQELLTQTDQYVVKRKKTSQKFSYSSAQPSHDLAKILPIWC